MRGGARHLIPRRGHAARRAGARLRPLDAGGEILVIDPGAFGGADALDGANAVLVTHEHFDHVEPDTLRAAMTANPGLRLWAAAPVAGQFGDSATGSAGSGAARLHRRRVQHARVRQAPRDDPPRPPGRCERRVPGGRRGLHPGDSYTVPEDPVNTLLVPISGPWFSTREMIDYVRAVAPRRTFAVHDALLSPVGLNVTAMFTGLAAGPKNASYTWWNQAAPSTCRPPRQSSAPPFVILKPRPSLSRTKLQDHGTTSGGACDAKCEILDPADLGNRLVIEWTADLSQANPKPTAPRVTPTSHTPNSPLGRQRGQARHPARPPETSPGPMAAHLPRHGP